MWLAYIGRVRQEERHADARAAAIIAAIYESRRNPKRRARAFTARDFLPKYPDDRPPTALTPAPNAPINRRLSADESARYAVSIFERRHRRT